MNWNWKKVLIIAFCYQTFIALFLPFGLWNIPIIMFCGSIWVLIIWSGYKKELKTCKNKNGE